MSTTPAASPLIRPDNTALAPLAGMSPLGLGTGRLASLGSHLTSAQRTALIHTAIDHGIRVLDTADTYASGDSERAIGTALQQRQRDDCFLITKAGFRHVALPAAFSPLNQVGKKLLQKVAPGRNFSRAYLLRSVKQSLRRLGTDHVDAFLLHAARFGETHMETWEALEHIRSSGMSRATGVSSSDPALVQEALKTGQVQVVETPVSLSSPSCSTILELCREHRIPVVANEVLKPLARLQQQAPAWNLLKERHHAFAANTVDVLIAFAAAQPAVCTTLVGTSSPTHLLANQSAFGLIAAHPLLFQEMKERFS